VPARPPWSSGERTRALNCISTPARWSSATWPSREVIAFGLMGRQRLVHVPCRLPRDGSRSRPAEAHQLFGRCRRNGRVQCDRGRPDLGRACDRSRARTELRSLDALHLARRHPFLVKNLIVAAWDRRLQPLHRPRDSDSSPRSFRNTRRSQPQTQLKLELACAVSPSSSSWVWVWVWVWFGFGFGFGLRCMVLRLTVLRVV